MHCRRLSLSLVFAIAVCAVGSPALGQPALIEEAEPIFRLPAIEDEPPPRANRFRGDDDRAPAAFRFLWAPAQAVSGGGELSQQFSQLNAGYPLYIEPTGESLWLATAGLDHLQFGGDAILPDSGIPLPDELWKINLGVFHRRRFDSGWEAGGLLSFGSASDRPFAQARDLTLTALGFVQIPSGPRDAWNLSLFYSPTSQLPFPIPGVAYVWRPNEQFTANLGVPFSLRYESLDGFRLTAAYRPITDFLIRAERELSDYWSVFAGYRIANETYWLADRDNSQDRLYVFDQRVSLGVQRELPFGFRLEIAAHYLFDRRIFQGESFFDERRDVIGIEPGLAGGLSLVWMR